MINVRMDNELLKHHGPHVRPDISSVAAHGVKETDETASIIEKIHHIPGIQGAGDQHPFQETPSGKGKVERISSRAPTFKEEHFSNLGTGSPWERLKSLFTGINYEESEPLQFTTNNRNEAKRQGGVKRAA